MSLAHQPLTTTTMHLTHLKFAVALLLVLLPSAVLGQGGLYPRAARVYLPRLRRLLSFGGIVNRQPQDVVVSLDLSKEWPTDSPPLTSSSTTLGMGGLETRAFDMIPVVSRNGDSYDIMVYGGMTFNGTRGPRRYMLSTKDGVRIDAVRAVDLGARDYTAMIPTMSSVAIVLDEYFKDQDAQGNAPTYIVGGKSFGNVSAPATATVASLVYDKPANAFPATIRQVGPTSTEYSGLVYVTPSQLMIAGGSEKAWLFDLMRMEWSEYKGMFPPTVAKRYKNQLVTYTAPSRRTYVISVGTDYTNSAGLFIYTDTTTQTNFTDGGPIPGFDKVMYFHSVFMVDDQIVAIGVTVDMNNAEQFEPVLVFKVTESSPGVLAFSQSDKFLPSSAGSSKPIGPQDPTTSPSSNLGLILGISVPVILLFAAGALVYMRRRRQTRQALTGDVLPPAPTTQHQHSLLQPVPQTHVMAPAPAAFHPTHPEELAIEHHDPKFGAASKGFPPVYDAAGTLILSDMPVSATRTAADQEELILGDVPIGRGATSETRR